VNLHICFRLIVVFSSNSTQQWLPSLAPSLSSTTRLVTGELKKIIKFQRFKGYSLRILQVRLLSVHPNSCLYLHSSFSTSYRVLSRTHKENPFGLSVDVHSSCLATQREDYFGQSHHRVRLREVHITSVWSSSSETPTRFYSSRNNHPLHSVSRTHMKAIY
jgi:hypothetical protein